MPEINVSRFGAEYELWDADHDTGIEVEQSPDEDKIRFTTAGTERAQFDDVGNGFVNGTTPMTFNNTGLGSGVDLEVQWLTRKNDADTSVCIGTVSHSDTAGRAGVIFGGRSRGSEGSETATQDGDGLFDFAAVGHDGTDFTLAGRISFIQDGAGATASSPGKIGFYNTKSGDTNVTEFMMLSSTELVLNDNSEAFGYRFETTGDEYALYNDSTNDTWSMGTQTTELTINSLTVKPKLLVDRGGGDSNINFISLSNQDGASAGAFMVGARSRGAGTGPTTYQAVQNGDRGLVFRSDMHDGTGFITNGLFQFLVDNTVSTGVIPSRMEISVTDTAGTLFTHTTFDSLGDLQFNPAGGSDITLFAAGGIRANRNQNSGATADFIYSSATYANHFRIDVSADQTNIGNATQGSLVSFDGSTLVATFNRSNAGANIVVESSSAGVDLWETDTTNDLIANYGGVVVPPTRVTTTYTILRSDHEVFCNTDSAGFTVTLPAGVNGQRYRIVNTGSSGNTLTIAPNGAETIGGAAASVTLADGETLILTYQTTDGWY